MRISILTPVTQLYVATYQVEADFVTGSDLRGLSLGCRLKGLLSTPNIG